MSWYPDLAHDQAGGDGGRRGITQMIVMHATDNTASDEGEAHYAEHRADGTSAHFYSDEDSVIQALDTRDIAYGCYPTGNSRSIQFEMTGLSNHVTDATMRRVAPIVARVCADWAIPIRHIGPAELRAGQLGICGHGDVTRAWGEGDHTDPGDTFPWATFIGYVSGGHDMEWTDKLDSIRTYQTAIEEIHAATHSTLNDQHVGVAVRVQQIQQALTDVQAKIATLATPQVDLTALAAALKPVLAGVVADELARRLQE